MPDIRLLGGGVLLIDLKFPSKKSTHANGHLHIYFFKTVQDQHTTQETGVFIYFFSFLLLSNCVDFLTLLDFIWPFDSTPRKTRTFYSETLFLCFYNCFCSLFVHSRRNFFFLHQSLSSMSAFNFSLSTIR